MDIENLFKIKEGLTGLEVAEGLHSNFTDIVDELNNKQISGDYATKQELNTKANAEDIPTKVSELYNDSGYLASVPSEYITESELQSKNYATTNQLNNKADKVVVVNGGNGDITKEIEPNKFYVFGECTNLNITLAAEIAGIYNEYSFKFESGATATVLADIPNVKWIGDKTIKPNTTYIVAITSGLGVIGGA